MNIPEYLKSLKRRSKKEDIPGTVEAYLDELCHACGKKLTLYKKCCGSEFGYKECPSCRYRIQLTS